MPRGRAGRVFLAEFGVIFHNVAHQLFDHLLPDRGVLRRGQFGDRLGDRSEHFIGVDGIRLAASRRIFGKKIVDQLVERIPSMPEATSEAEILA